MSFKKDICRYDIFVVSVSHRFERTREHLYGCLGGVGSDAVKTWTSGQWEGSYDFVNYSS